MYFYFHNFFVFQFHFFRFLATGGSYRSLGHSFSISPSTVGLIVFETCDAIWDSLQLHCFPDFTQALWEEKARRFGELRDFKYCVGAIGGKHVRVACPPSNDSFVLNDRKSVYSIQLQAVVDADLMFTAIDVGDFGTNSDGAVFKNSTFGQSLLNNTLNLPPPTTITLSGTKTPYCFIADEAYPLKDILMRPYGGRNLDSSKRIFNQRLSRARECVECAFGILAAKWEVFQRPLKLNVSNSVRVVKAACALHNFVRARDGKFSDLPASHRETPTPSVPMLRNIEAIAHSGRSSDTATQIREYLTHFFIDEDPMD